MLTTLLLIAVAVLALIAAHQWRKRRSQPPGNRPKSDGGPGEEKPR